ncbi:hypothetical protein CBS101457_004921 [Exobasidium rhododendri]|nr:hypothetical protein CBS101457_004921 [Exobasidium rhododendri]
MERRKSVLAITDAINDPSSRDANAIKDARDLMAKREQSTDMSSTSHAHFLNIPGLSRSLLDTCIETFFATLEHAMPLSYSFSNLWPRYRAFLDLTSGLEVNTEHAELSPVSELLILAIACRGCDNTQYVNRNQLSKAMIQRFIHLVDTGDALHLAGLDGVEAINLLAEKACRSKYLITDANRFPNITRLDVLGRGFSAELALSMQLQMPPPHCTTQETARRRFLFWTIFMHDAFISAAACHMYRIMEEDIGWQVHAEASQINPYGYNMYRLAMIARQACRDLMSFRAKSYKIHPRKVMEIFTSLQKWYDNLDKPFQYDWTIAAEEPPTRLSREKIGLISKRAFMLCIFHSLHLNVWASIEDSSLWDPLVPKEETVQAEAKIGEIMWQAFFTMASLARHCRRMNLVDHAPNNLRNVPAAWLLWCTRQSSLYQRSGYKKDVTQIRKACQDLVDCVASAHSCSDNDTLVQSLQDMLNHSFRSHKQQQHQHHQHDTTAVEVPNPYFPSPTQHHGNYGSSTAATVNPPSHSHFDEQLSLSTSMSPYLPIQSLPSAPVPIQQAAHHFLSPALNEEQEESNNFTFYPLESSESQASLSPDWDALNVVTAEVQAFLAGFGIEMPNA